MGGGGGVQPVDSYVLTRPLLGRAPLQAPCGTSTGRAAGLGGG